jgi:hypothetical protein
MIKEKDRALPGLGLVPINESVERKGFHHASKDH